MKRFYTITFIAIVVTLRSMAQIGFNDVNLEGWIGTGQNEAMFVVDFDSDPVGMDSTFAWGINFESDSINGLEILSLIEQFNPDFTYTVGGGFLDNIVYENNGQTFTNPNSGWFSIIESTDGENWEWNMGITDNIGNGQWYGMVAMNTVTYEAEINVPILTNVQDLVIAETFDVYPNPTSDKLNIKLTQPTKIYITNYTGQIVYNSFSKSETVDVSNFIPGMYIVTIIQSNSTKTQKVIIK